MLNPVAINSRLLLAAIVGLAVMLSRPAAAEEKQAEFRAGLVSVCITPEGPIPMCGYNPWMSEGVLDDLYAKAMAIEDAAGGGPCWLRPTCCSSGHRWPRRSAERLWRRPDWSGAKSC